MLPDERQSSYPPPAPVTGAPSAIEWLGAGTYQLRADGIWAHDMTDTGRWRVVRNIHDKTEIVGAVGNLPVYDGEAALALALARAGLPAQKRYADISAEQCAILEAEAERWRIPYFRGVHDDPRSLRAARRILTFNWNFGV